MRPWFAPVVCSVILTAGIPASAFAEDATFRFSGVVRQIHGQQPFSNIAVGTPFTGRYTIKLDTPDTNAHPLIADYWHRASQYGLTIEMAGRTFRTNPASGQVLVEVLNDYYSDSYVVRSYGNLATDGVAIDHLYWQLDDFMMTALASTALTSSAPDLSTWQQVFGLSIEGGGWSWTIAGEVTSIEREADASSALILLPAGSPAPAGYTLVGPFDLTPSVDPRSTGVVLRVDVYRKN